MSEVLRSCGVGKCHTRIPTGNALMSRAETLLARLEGVRQVAPSRWMARCSSHPDRSPSLSVRELDDKLLVHCFAGCDTEDVLTSAGLTFSDLYPERVRGSAPVASHIPASDRLELIDHEVSVCCLILRDILAEHTVQPSQWQRLAQAAARIGAARDDGNAVRVKEPRFDGRHS